MFFDDWQGLLRVVVVGTCAYVALIVLLRVSGKRTLSKMNAFDFVITVALGSTLATILLSKDAALAEGVVAFAMLVLLQFAITWLSVRSGLVRKLVKAEPQLLFHRGRFLDGALRETRVTREEICQAARAGGFADLGEIGAVVLETDGSISVIGHIEAGQDASLSNVEKPSLP
ncbi:MAG: DUF421 domain-containing protein [Proteobacteria bacterium]|nr:DUF421 domain-containing protein [Pseudomonadota bacterium]